MRKAAILAALALGAALSGCITPEQLAAQDDATCQSYGAAPGSSAYTDCRLRVAQQRQQAYQAFAAQMAANARAQQAANERATQTYIQATQPPAPTSATTTCTRTSSITATCTTNAY